MTSPGPVPVPESVADASPVADAAPALPVTAQASPPVARRAFLTVGAGLIGLTVGALLPLAAWHDAVPPLVWLVGVVVVVAVGGGSVAERSGGPVGAIAVAVSAGLGIGVLARSVDGVGVSGIVACTAGTLTALGVAALVGAVAPRRTPAVLRWLLVLLLAPVAYALVQAPVPALLRAVDVVPDDSALAVGWAAMLLGAVNAAFALGSTRRHQAAPDATTARAWASATTWALPLAGLNGPVVVGLHVAGEFVGTPIMAIIRAVGHLP